MYSMINDCFSNRSEQEYHAIMDGSRILFNRCTSQWSSAVESSVSMVQASLSLALTAIGIFQEYCPESQQYQKSASLNKALSDLDESLRKWIDNRTVIGKQMFGDFITTSWTGGYSTLVKLDREIMVKGLINTSLVYMKMLAVLNVEQPSCILFHISFTYTVDDIH